jgi:hypothetical protein
MKKAIVYILMFIFLLFTAENKQTLDFQQDFGIQNVSLHLFPLQKNTILIILWKKRLCSRSAIL